MRDSHVVDAEHDDRVQDDDLTQEHHFFLRTFGTEICQPSVPIGFSTVSTSSVISTSSTAGAARVISTSDSVMLYKDSVDTLGYLTMH